VTNITEALKFLNSDNPDFRSATCALLPSETGFRMGNVELKWEVIATDSHAQIRNGELIIHNPRSWNNDTLFEDSEPLIWYHLTNLEIDHIWEAKKLLEGCSIITPSDLEKLIKIFGESNLDSAMGFTPNTSLYDYAAICQHLELGAADTDILLQDDKNRVILISTPLPDGYRGIRLRNSLAQILHNTLDDIDFEAISRMVNHDPSLEGYHLIPIRLLRVAGDGFSVKKEKLFVLSGTGKNQKDLFIMVDSEFTEFSSAHVIKDLKSRLIESKAQSKKEYLELIINLGCESKSSALEILRQNVFSLVKRHAEGHPWSTQQLMERSKLHAALKYLNGRARRLNEILDEVKVIPPKPLKSVISSTEQIVRQLKDAEAQNEALERAIQRGHTEKIIELEKEQQRIDKRKQRAYEKLEVLAGLFAPPALALTFEQVYTHFRPIPLFISLLTSAYLVGNLVRDGVLKRVFGRLDE